MSNDIIQYNNNDNQAHGYVELYWNNNLGIKGYYINGKEVGYHLNYNFLGKLTYRKYNIL